jgi:hypothetical protein
VRQTGAAFTAFERAKGCPMELQTRAAFTALERAKGGAPVGVSLLTNALGQPMHQGLAKCISRASALLQAINCASGLQAGARPSGVLDGRLQQWQTWIVVGRLRGWRGGERFRLPSHRCRSALARECVGSVDASVSASRALVGSLDASVAGENAFRGQARSYRRSTALSGSWRGRRRSRPSAPTVGFTRCELAGKRSASAYHTSSAIP